MELQGKFIVVAALAVVAMPIPIPPVRAITMAIDASVTVSMLADKIGIANSMVGVIRVVVETALRLLMPEYWGTIKTSSKVKAIDSLIFMRQAFLFQ